MEMIQTYQGHFLEDGRFVPDSVSAKIPVGRRAIVNILGDEVSDVHAAPHAEVSNQQKAVSIKQILADALEVENDVLTDADWNEMANLRSQTNAGLSRAVKL